jgi:hypothetical protein
MATVDARVSNAVTEIDGNTKLIHDVSDQFANITDAEMQLHLHLLRTVAVTQRALLTVERHFEKFLLGVQELLQGRLTSYLLPVKSLSQILSKVSTSLQHRYPSFKSVNLHPSFYYNIKSIPYARHNDNICLTIKIPVANLKYFNGYILSASATIYK